MAADLSGHPPDGGVVEEERFDRGLDQVGEVVVAADVGQLVGEDRLDLLGREASEDAGGEEDDGLEEADDGGDLDEGRFEELDGAAEAEPGGKLGEGGAPGWIVGAAVVDGAFAAIGGTWVIETETFEGGDGPGGFSVLCGRGGG